MDGPSKNSGSWGILTKSSLFGKWWGYKPYEESGTHCWPLKKNNSQTKLKSHSFRFCWFCYVMLFESVCAFFLPCLLPLGKILREKTLSQPQKYNLGSSEHPFPSTPPWVSWPWTPCLSWFPTPWGGSSPNLLGDKPKLPGFGPWNLTDILLMVQDGSGIRRKRTSWYMVNGKYHTIHKVLYIPGGCAGFLPSKVTPENGQMLGLQKKEIYI